ncbi:MAG: TolC family protein [Steroidobacteraceae bacterium]
MQWFGFLPLLLLGPPTVKAEEQPLSLDAAVELALGAAPQVSARAESLTAAQSLTVSAGRLPDPQLIVGIDNLPVTGSAAYSTTSDFMTMRKVGVMQEFPRTRKRRLQHDLAEAEAGVAGAQLVQTRLDIAREVATAWIRRATAQQALEDLRALEPEVALQAVAARTAVAAGRSSTAEALAAEAAVAALTNRMLRMRSEVRTAALELSRWVDVEPTRPLASIPSLEQLPTPVEA